MRIALASLAFAAALAIPAAARAQLAPPPPMQPQQPAQPGWNPFLPQAPANQPYGQYAGPSATQQQLDASEAAGEGRGLEIAWANVEGGGSYANFGSNATTGGAMLGVGVGARFVMFSLGARVRVAPYKDFTLLQFLGEAGLHLPSGMWDPYAKLRVGYGKTSDIGGTSVSFGGLDLGGAVGADYYLSQLLSLGLEGSADALFFDSKGVALAGSAHLGFHFNL